jgi:hypothetical protein
MRRTPLAPRHLTTRGTCASALLLTIVGSVIAGCRARQPGTARLPGSTFRATCRRKHWPRGGRSFASTRLATSSSGPTPPGCARWSSGRSARRLHCRSTMRCGSLAIAMTDGALLEFLESTYVATAELGEWDCAALERT